MRDESKAVIEHDLPDLKLNVQTILREIEEEAKRQQTASPDESVGPNDGAV